MTDQEFKLKMREPKFKKDVLQIDIQRIYTDVNGTILDKNDPLIPDALKVQIPLYVFGQYDRIGAYVLGIKNTPAPVGCFFLQTYTWGVGNPFFFGFTGLSDIEKKLKPGDLITVYTDNVNFPNAYVFVIQTCPTRSLTSILNNLPNLPYDPDYGYLRVTGFDYYVAVNNDEQWKENIKFLTYDMLGLVKSNDLSPYASKPAKTINNQFIAIRYKFRLDQYVGLNTYMLFETDNITLTFFIEHRLNELKK